MVVKEHISCEPHHHIVFAGNGPKSAPRTTAPCIFFLFFIFCSEFLTCLGFALARLAVTAIFHHFLICFISAYLCTTK